MKKPQMNDMCFHGPALPVGGAPSILKVYLNIESPVNHNTTISIINPLNID